MEDALHIVARLSCLHRFVFDNPLVVHLPKQNTTYVPVEKIVETRIG